MSMTTATILSFVSSFIYLIPLFLLGKWAIKKIKERKFIKGIGLFIIGFIGIAFLKLVVTKTTTAFILMQGIH